MLKKEKIKSKIKSKIKKIKENINIKGILDPLGTSVNPLTELPYTDTYLRLAKIWSKFPAYKQADTIIQDIQQHQVILVTSATGSGKSVLIPKFLLHVLDYKKNIAVTLPKQIITKSVAEFAASTLDVELGQEVGYKYKNSPSNSYSSKTKLLFATDGTLVAKLLKDSLLQEFDGVIIDEAHERKIQIDFLLYLLRITLSKRPEFKLIIMSATINVDIFINYFQKFKFKYLNLEGETNFKIKSLFLESSKNINYNDIMKTSFDIILNLLKDQNTQEGDILMFVSSVQEAFDTCKKLNNLIMLENKVNNNNNKNNNNNNKNKCIITCSGDVFCVEVFSGMDLTQEDLAKDINLYKKNSKFTRKLVVATDVAESSVTIDGLKYIIDTGHKLQSSYDPNINAKVLERELISQAQVKQRMGRVGRTGEGVCYHMYTQEDYEKMLKFPVPEIRSSDLSEICLKLLATYGNVKEVLKVFVDFIEPPSEKLIINSIENVERLNCITDNKINEYGLLLNDLNIDITYVNLLIYSKLYNCSYEIIKIISILEATKKDLNSLFIKVDRDNKQELNNLNKAKNKFKDKSSDCISLLNIYEEFIKNNSINWARKYYLKYNILLKAKFLVGQNKRNLLFKIQDLDLSKLNLEINKNFLTLPVDSRILIAINLAYKFNVATRVNNYYNIKKDKDVKLNIDRSSFLNDSKFREVIYFEIFVNGGRANLKILSKKL
jgi:pre-mRNA-splicing factor ATP-dependent RNA helicase DHX38/PRP16